MNDELGDELARAMYRTATDDNTLSAKLGKLRENRILPEEAVAMILDGTQSMEFASEPFCRLTALLDCVAALYYEDALGKNELLSLKNKIVAACATNWLNATTTEVYLTAVYCGWRNVDAHQSRHPSASAYLSFKHPEVYRPILIRISDHEHPNGSVRHCAGEVIRDDPEKTLGDALEAFDRW
jgi:hypothetical protein